MMRYPSALGICESLLIALIVAKIIAEQDALCSPTSVGAAPTCPYTGRGVDRVEGRSSSI